MGLLARLRSVLGAGGEEQGQSADAGTAVTVEREPEAESELAVKGVEPAQPSTGGDGSDDAADAPSPGESSPGASGAGGRPVDAIKGIGPAYADRLADAGVHTVSDLAEADADELAAATDIGEGRLGTWIEHAAARTG